MSCSYIATAASRTFSRRALPGSGQATTIGISHASRRRPGRRPGSRRRADCDQADTEADLGYPNLYSLRPVTLRELVAVTRRRDEDSFAEAKNEISLQYYQVRKCRAWHRDVTVSILTHAFLAVTSTTLTLSGYTVPCGHAAGGAMSHRSRYRVRHAPALLARNPYRLYAGQP